MNSHQSRANEPRENSQYGDSQMVNYLANRHRMIWEHMITRSGANVEGQRVLDYGCSDGSFFHVLHSVSPFASGVGIDKATPSLDKARGSQASLNLEYREFDRSDSPRFHDLKSSIDTAFSHEVVYQISDLDDHFSFIKGLLKDGGRYIAVTGCHTDFPLWPLWKRLREERGDAANFPHYDYSPRDISDAGLRAGFSNIEVVAFDWTPPAHFELVPADPYRAAFWPSVEESLSFYKNHKLIFICS